MEGIAAAFCLVAWITSSSGRGWGLDPSLLSPEKADSAPLARPHDKACGPAYAISICSPLPSSCLSKLSPPSSSLGWYGPCFRTAFALSSTPVIWGDRSAHESIFQKGNEQRGSPRMVQKPFASRIGSSFVSRCFGKIRSGGVI